MSATPLAARAADLALPELLTAASGFVKATAESRVDDELADALAAQAMLLRRGVVGEPRLHDHIGGGTPNGDVMVRLSTEFRSCHCGDCYGKRRAIDALAAELIGQFAVSPDLANRDCLAAERVRTAITGGQT